MQVITSIKDMRSFSKEAVLKGKAIGFVPTMGYLHEGHLSLIRAAREECDVVVVSVFVNPTQFGEGEDLDKYPRDLDRDKTLSEKAGADVVFLPSTEEIYPEDTVTSIKISGDMANRLCGVSRPGHFDGVATIVAKLFNIIMPDKAYFGQKDAQQSVIVKRMVKDLNMLVEIRILPIVREDDGLAMSSRNTYLSSDERSRALNICSSLEKAKIMIADGGDSSAEIKGVMEDILREDPGLEIDYVEIVDADTLKPVDKVTKNTLIAIAAFAGKTRLIDNIVVNNDQ